MDIVIFIGLWIIIGSLTRCATIWLYAQEYFHFYENYKINYDSPTFKKELSDWIDNQLFSPSLLQCILFWPAIVICYFVTMVILRIVKFFNATSELIDRLFSANYKEKFIAWILDSHRNKRK